MAKEFYAKLLVSDNSTESDMRDMMYNLRFAELLSKDDVIVYRADVVHRLTGDELENELFSIVERAIQHIIKQRGFDDKDLHSPTNNSPEVMALRSITDMEKGKAVQYLMKSGIDVILLNK